MPDEVGGSSQVDSEINRESNAWALADQVRQGSRTAMELLEQSLAAIAAHDPDVNAFTVVLEDRARAQAHAADELAARSRTTGEPVPPLLGVPVSVKDHIWLAGAPATNGSQALRDFVPDVDAVPVRRLVDAGAVIVGKTTNPEFCYRGFTASSVWGTTRNPWDLSRTPGGSSGGAGASVAYGATRIALGTDGGGSIRIPSAFCGVVGHKPTFGRVPKLPGFLGWPTLSVDGPLARSVPDAAAALAVMAGPAPEDDLTWPVPLPDLRRAVTEEPDWSSLRIAWSDDLGWAPVEPDVLAAFHRALDVLADAGAQLVQAHPDTPYPTELWNNVALVEGFVSEGHLLEKWESQLTPGTADIIRAGKEISGADYVEAQRQRWELGRVWGQFFDRSGGVGDSGYDLILLPTMQLTAFSTEVSGPASIAGTPIDPFFDDWCTLALPANLCGLPSTSVPVGTGADGLPVAMQVMGPRWADARTLAVAAAFERRCPFRSPVG